MIPYFIYKRLPHTYLIMGTLVVYYFSSPASALGLISGVILILMALLVFRLRYEYRVLRT